MPALRIAVIPDLTTALQKSHEEKEVLLDSACQAIIAQGIANLEFGFSAVMQCVLWVSGPPEAIGALRTHLNQNNAIYESYDATAFDSEDAQPEDHGNGKTH